MGGNFHGRDVTGEPMLHPSLQDTSRRRDTVYTTPIAHMARTPSRPGPDLTRRYVSLIHLSSFGRTGTWSLFQPGELCTVVDLIPS